jgi:hypothetical protein
VAKFKYCGTTPTNQNAFTKNLRADYSANERHRSVQNLLSSRVICINVYFEIYQTIILSPVLCGLKTLSLTLKEEHTLKVAQNRMLRRIFGPQRREVTGGWIRLHKEEFIICNPLQTLSQCSNQD